MDAKITYGKKKLISGKKSPYKTWSVEMKLKLPKMLDIHYAWSHPDDIERAKIAPRPIYIDHTNISETDFLFYRALMLEAGFVPVYSWFQEVKHILYEMQHKPSKIKIPKNWKAVGGKIEDVYKKFIK